MLQVIQINVQHSRAAPCRILTAGRVDMALIQEPWIVKGQVVSLREARGKLIYGLQSGNVRSCIFVKKKQRALTLLDFCCRDLAAIRLKYHVVVADKDLVLAFAYLPPPSEELEQLE
jgi:hypothetical protein